MGRPARIRVRNCWLKMMKASRLARLAAAAHAAHAARPHGVDVVARLGETAAQLFRGAGDLHLLLNASPFIRQLDYVLCHGPLTSLPGYANRCGWLGRKRSQLTNLAIGTDGPGQAESVPITTIEPLPGFAIVIGDIGSIAADRDPGLVSCVPGHGRTIAVGWFAGCAPVFSAVGGVSCRAGCLPRLAIISTDSNSVPLVAKR